VAQAALCPPVANDGLLALLSDSRASVETLTETDRFSETGVSGSELDLRDSDFSLNAGQKVWN